MCKKLGLAVFLTCSITEAGVFDSEKFEDKYRGEERFLKTGFNKTVTDIFLAESRFLLYHDSRVLFSNLILPFPKISQPIPFLPQKTNSKYS